MEFKNDTSQIRMGKFLKEILEQPQALQETLNYFTSEKGLKDLESIQKEYQSGKYRQIIFTGMGSSNFTSQAAATLFNDLGLSIPAFSVNASELLHYQKHLLQPESILVCFSQSGESFEIRELLKIRPADSYCIGITNEINSTLTQHTHTALISKAGKEEMTSTKTYVSTALISFILGWSLHNKWDEKQIGKVKRMIEHFALFLENYQAKISRMIDFLGELPALTIIARGPSISTAHQSALMCKEAIKIPAYSMLGGEFRHGPMEMVGEQTKTVLFAPLGRTYTQNIKMAEDIARFGGKVLLITNSEYVSDNSNILVEKVQVDDEYLFAIEAILPMQLFVDMYAKKQGFYAGSFSHGAKVTTVE